MESLQGCQLGCELTRCGSHVEGEQGNETRMCSLPLRLMQSEAAAQELVLAMGDQDVGRECMGLWTACSGGLEGTVKVWNESKGTLRLKGTVKSQYRNKEF